MGSHNFTDNALQRNDPRPSVRFADATVSNAFSQNFDRLWNDPAMSWGCSRAGARTTLRWKSGDTEVTKIARAPQTAKRALPRPCATPGTAPVHGRPEDHYPGLLQACGPPRRCASNISAGSSRAKVLRVVIRSDKPCRCASCSRRKRPSACCLLKRSAAYRYVPRSHAPSACRGHTVTRAKPATDRRCYAGPARSAWCIDRKAQTVTGLDPGTGASRMPGTSPPTVRRRPAGDQILLPSL